MGKVTDTEISMLMNNATVIAFLDRIMLYL